MPKGEKRRSLQLTASYKKISLFRSLARNIWLFYTGSSIALEATKKKSDNRLPLGIYDIVLQYLSGAAILSAYSALSKK